MFLSAKTFKLKIGTYWSSDLIWFGELKCRWGFSFPLSLFHICYYSYYHWEYKSLYMLIDTFLFLIWLCSALLVIMLFVLPFFSCADTPIMLYRQILLLVSLYSCIYSSISFFHFLEILKEVCWVPFWMAQIPNLAKLSPLHCQFYT